jgi:hypothetical protein
MALNAPSAESGSHRKPAHVDTAPNEGWGECPHEPIQACYILWRGSTESRPTGFGAVSRCAHRKRGGNVLVALLDPHPARKNRTSARASAKV